MNSIKARRILLPVSEPRSDPIFEVASSTGRSIRSNPVDEWIDEINFDTFSDKSEVVRTFELSSGTALGISLASRTHDTSDPYIADNSLRNSISSHLKKLGLGRPVRWRESGGVLELGTGLAGTIPIASFAGASLNGFFGFFAGSIIRYRTLEAIVGFTKKAGGMRPKSGFQVPLTPALAVKMPLGSEIELIGQGRLFTNGGIFLAAGPYSGPYAAGVSATLTAGTFKAGEYGLTVTALDGATKIRVALRHISQEEQGLSAAINAGIISPGWTGAPIVGNGLLQFMVGNNSMNRVQNMFTNYTSLALGVSLSLLKKKTQIVSYDLDLRTRETRDAYSQLLCLSPDFAERLSALPGSGVQRTKIIEQENELRSAFEINLFGEKLALAQTLENEKRGEISSCNGLTSIYKDSTFRKTYGNILTGTKDITWEAVSVKESENGIQKPYFRLRFNRKDRDFGMNRLDRFFRFADLLNISPGEIQADRTRYEECKKLFSRSIEIVTTADIFFTKCGIDHIRATDLRNAQKAYLVCSKKLSKKYEHFPLLVNGELPPNSLALINDFRQFNGLSYLVNVAKFKALIKTRKAYTDLTGRSVARDSKLLKKAEQFATLVAQFADSQCPDQIEKLFMGLAKLNGIHFMQTIAALGLLAGAKETLVHRLQISGRGISLESQDEGALQSPRETALAQLNRAAIITD